MKKNKTNTEIFKITEQLAPLKALTMEKDVNAFEIIEQDIRDMMHNIAEAEFSQSEQEKLNAEKIERLLLSIIEAMDAFDRVFGSIRAKQEQVDRQMKKWMGNFRTIRRMLNKILTEQGVSIVENLDQGLDPHWHRISETVEDFAKPDGTIIEELLKGYVWHNKILRKAEVVVVRNAQD